MTYIGVGLIFLQFLQADRRRRVQLDSLIEVTFWYKLLVTKFAGATDKILSRDVICDDLKKIPVDLLLRI